VSNLVSNAIKFTAAGEVAVEMSVHQLAAGEQRVIVRVRDSGIGMDAATAGRLFENFVQADASTTRTFGGSGLGLAITRRLARMMVETGPLVEAIFAALAKGKHEITFPRFIATGYLVRAIAPGVMRRNTKRQTLDALAKEGR
jgi:signal transduction histidine kinase